MSSFFMPSGKDDKGYICDMCEKSGQPTLSWPNKDFNLCYACLHELTIQYKKEIKEAIRG